jgi:hypothetical protein
MLEVHTDEFGLWNKPGGSALEGLEFAGGVGVGRRKKYRDWPLDSGESSYYFEIAGFGDMGVKKDPVWATALDSEHGLVLIGCATSDSEPPHSEQLAHRLSEGSIVIHNENRPAHLKQLGRSHLNRQTSRPHIRPRENPTNGPRNVLQED